MHRDYLHWIWVTLCPMFANGWRRLEFEILSSYRKNYRYLQFLQPAYARIKAQMEATGGFTHAPWVYQKSAQTALSAILSPKRTPACSLVISFVNRAVNMRSVSGLNYSCYNYETRQVVIEESETITLINASGLSIEVSDIDEDTEFIDVIMIQSKQSEGFYKVKKQVIEWFDVFMGFKLGIPVGNSLVLVDVPRPGELNPEYKTDKNSWLV